MRRAFPDGVYLVDVTSLEDHLLLGDRALAALGIVDRSSRPAPDLRVLATGREPLRVLGQRVLEVAPARWRCAAFTCWIAYIDAD